MRDIYERVLADREARGVASDVPVEDILAVVERKGSEQHRTAVLNRLLATAEGRRELDLVRAAVRASQPARAHRFRIPLAIAATLVLAVLGRFAFRNNPPTDVLRGDPTALVLWAPPANVTTTDSLRFAWSPVLDARQYQVEVLDDSGLITWTQTIPDTSIALPGNVSLAPGRTYRWRVVAKRESGEIASASRTLRIQPR